MPHLTTYFPETFSLLTNMKDDELMSAMRKEYGLKLYQTGQLTLSQAAIFCEMNMYEFVSLLTLLAIPVVDYPTEELEKEFDYLSEKIV
jgi:predicted HTH domain antitoxin